MPIKARSCDLAFLFLIKRELIQWHIKRRTSVKKNVQSVSESLVGPKSWIRIGTVWCTVQIDVDG